MRLPSFEDRYLRIQFSQSKQISFGVTIIGRVPRRLTHQTRYRLNVDFINWLEDYDPQMFQDYHFDQLIVSSGSPEAVSKAGTHYFQYIPAALNDRVQYKQFMKTNNPPTFDESLFELSLSYLSEFVKELMPVCSRLSYQACYHHFVQTGSILKSVGSHMLTDFSSKVDFVFSDEFKESLQEYEKPGGGGSYWTLNNKDELRDAQKVVEEKTRIFNCSSTPLLFVTASFFLDYQNRLIENYRNHQIKVGFTDVGSSWDSVVAAALSSPNATDVSGWDWRFSSQMMIDVFSVFRPYFDDVIEYDNMVREHVSKVCIGVDGNLFHITTSMPTGSFITLLFNCLHHFRLFAYVYLMRMKSIGLEQASYLHFRKWKFNIVGDDNLFPTFMGIDASFYKQTLSSIADVEIDSRNPPVFCGGHSMVFEGIYRRYNDPSKMLCSMAWTVEHPEPDLIIMQKTMSLARAMHFHEHSTLYHAYANHLVDIHSEYWKLNKTFSQIHRELLLEESSS